MQRNHSAQNRNKLCATHWKNRCVLYWGRPIQQHVSPLLKSLLLSFATVRRRKIYHSHLWCIMTFLTGGKGPGGVGDVSSSFHPKQGTVFSYLRLTSQLTFWQIHRCFGDPGDPWVMLLAERLSHSTSLQGEGKNYLRKTTQCISVGMSLLNAVISVVFSANYTQTLHHSDSSAPHFEFKRAQNYKKQLKDESRNQTRWRNWLVFCKALAVVQKSYKCDAANIIPLTRNCADPPCSDGSSKKLKLSFRILT